MYYGRVFTRRFVALNIPWNDLFTDRVKQLNFKIYAFSQEQFIRFSGHLILVIRAITWNIMKDGAKRRRLQIYYSPVYCCARGGRASRWSGSQVGKIIGTRAIRLTWKTPSVETTNGVLSQIIFFCYKLSLLRMLWHTNRRLNEKLPAFDSKSVANWNWNYEMNAPLRCCREASRNLSKQEVIHACT